MSKIDILWFEDNILCKLVGYDINIRHFPKGDFGKLDQVSIESNRMGCEVEFWGSGRISIFIWDYLREKELLNELLITENDAQKKKSLTKTLDILLQP